MDNTTMYTLHRLLHNNDNEDCEAESVVTGKRGVVCDVM